jgi:hypothetical protein
MCRGPGGEAPAHNMCYYAQLPEEVICHPKPILFCYIKMGKINKLGFQKNVWKLKKRRKKGKMCGTSKNLLKMCGSSICCII